MTVFVAQRHLVVDRNSRNRQLIDKYDLTDALRFGPLVYCVEGEVDVGNPALIISQLDEALVTYGPLDFLLLIGNPLVIGLAVAIASHLSSNGVVNCLQWSPPDRGYIPITFNLYGEPE